MPAYNAGLYLDEAVTSILNQTFRDFELIIVDDGSVDATAAILHGYEKSDARLRVYHQENRGMIAALNFGCRLARGKYIARMDADDISLPTRLEKQLEYLEQHPDIGILGAWICNIDKNGSTRGTWCPPTNAKTLKWTHFFGVCVSHPTVLMRREVLEQLNYYRSDASHVEDVDLWLRASRITEFGNVPKLLYKYRIWGGSTHQGGLQVRSDCHVQLLASYIADFLNIDPPVEAVRGLRQTRIGPPFENLKHITLTAELIRDLYQRFINKNQMTPQARNEISWDAAKRLGSLALQASRLDTRAFLSLLMKALQLDYRLLYPSAVMRGLERAFEQRL
jgi:Glycosyl transferase family 2